MGISFLFIVNETLMNNYLLIIYGNEAIMLIVLTCNLNLACTILPKLLWSVRNQVTKVNAYTNTKQHNMKSLI